MNSKEIAIKVENISKCYRIGLKENVHDTIGKSIFNFMKAPYKNYTKYRSLYKFDDINPDQNNNSSDIIWAVRDVSFEIKKGEIVGIIGENGAGKSTLLKILSKITEPTTGRITIHGKVSSLLEVGTGFHPELTGRENVYLNGTILGMRKKEIDQKFDEIVDFSGVEKFIDTPVKRYSSGMKVRLAFAVSAHLETEILIIDEVLAVGDARFQKKCLDKMKSIGRHGRTVLFVSHSMPVVTRLCPRTIMLNAGSVQIDDLSHSVISAYMSSGKAVKAKREWKALMEAPGDEVARVRSVQVRTKECKNTEVVDIRKHVGIEMRYEILQPGYVLRIRYHVSNDEGTKIFQSIENETIWRGKTRQPGEYVSTAWIPGNLLSEGLHFVAVALRTIDPSVLRFRVDDAVAFQIVDSMDHDSARSDYTGNMDGLIRPLLKWETNFSPMNPSPLFRQGV